MAKADDAQDRPAPPAPPAVEGSAPDFRALEERVLRRWREEGTFEALRRRREGAPLFSFLDGPITANNPMGIHHAWGRTLKDAFLRYRALRGCDARYQNGFDCQGLWVEVEVEKALGFQGKPDIEAYGLDRFSRACRERVDEYARVITEQSIRLGQWMDWENSYFTYDDENILGIWHFLKRCHERGWLYRSGRPMPWCPRCGTSLSEHEMAGSYRDVEHLSITAALPLRDGSGRRLLVWTTTPWTLSANVAAAVHPKLDYVELAVPGREERLVACADALPNLGLEGARVERTFPGRELVGLAYETCFPGLEPQRGVSHRVVAWDAVDATEGTGIVHIAPGCGREDHELGQAEGLAVVCPVDEQGRFLAEFGWLAGRAAGEVARDVADALERDGKLLRAGPHRHAYPVCWRCKEELIFRLVEEWFIACDEIRGPMLEAAREVEWSPAFVGKRMEDWLHNMGDWCISRKRFWGLPLPFYACEDCGALHVVGSREELRERALDPAAVDALPELHRPWIDAVAIRCPDCPGTARRIPEVGDCWLDAGIVPYTTLGYFDEPARFERAFPADWICEMREQVRLWFYSMLFMGVTISGRAPYRRVLAYERVVSETGEMFSKTGFMIRFDEAVERLGADAMRYLYCSAPVARELRFSYAAGELAQRKLVALWNVCAFLQSYAAIDRPRVPEDAPERLPLADRWLLARTAQMVDEAQAAYEAWDTPAVVRCSESYLDDLSNWYVRGNRRRFWRAGAEADKRACYFALREAVAAALGVLSPVAPLLTDELWRQAVRPLRPGAPDSVHWTDWPRPDPAWRDPGLLERTAALRRLVKLAHSLRSEEGLKVRQPLPGLWVVGDATLAAALEEQRDAVAAELNVKEVGSVADAGAFYRPRLALDFRAAGPVLRERVDAAKRALEALSPQAMQAALAAFEADRDVPVPGLPEPLPAAILRCERQVRDGFRVTREGDWTVALDVRTSPELRREGMARDLVRHVQVLRKESGLEVTERIALGLDAEGDALRRAIEEQSDFIAREVLAEELVLGGLDAAEASREFAVEGARVRAQLRRV